MKSGTDSIKDLNTQRYYEERKYIREVAVKIVPRKNLCVEFYSGVNEMSKILTSEINTSITNDKDKKAPSQHHLDAGKFAETVLPTLGQVDLMDFDAYGCPNLVIQKAFEHIDRKSLPFVVTFTDGMGLAMIRGFSRVDYNKFYFWETKVKRLDKYHPLLVDWFFKRLAEKHGWKAEQKGLVQSKNNHFVFGCYLIYQ